MPKKFCEFQLKNTTFFTITIVHLVTEMPHQIFTFNFFCEIVEVIFVLFCFAEKHTNYLVSFDKKSKLTNYQKVALLKKLPSSNSWPGAFFHFFCKIQLSVRFLSFSLSLLQLFLCFVFCCFFATQSCQFIMSFSRDEVKTQNM